MLSKFGCSSIVDGSCGLVVDGSDVGSYDVIYIYIY